MGLDRPFFDDKNGAFWILQSIGWSGYFFLRSLSGFANSMGWMLLIHTLLLTATGYSLTLLIGAAFWLGFITYCYGSIWPYRHHRRSARQCRDGDHAGHFPIGTLTPANRRKYSTDTLGARAQVDSLGAADPPFGHRSPRLERRPPRPHG